MAQDTADPLAAGLAAREAGDHAAASAHFARALAADPDNANLLRLLGTSYAFQGRHAEAVTMLERARALAPDDLDIRAALARAYLWSGREGQAADELNAIEARDPDNADLALIRAQLRRPAPDGTPRGGGGGVYANQTVAWIDLASGKRTWYETTLGAYVRASDRLSLGGEVERADRVFATDVTGRVRADMALGDATRGYVSISATPNADFREQWGVRAGVEQDVGAAITLLADFRYAQYASGDVIVAEPGVRLFFGRNRASLTGKMINLRDIEGDHRIGWSGRLDVPLPEGILAFAGAATYPDTEAGITRRVRAVYAGAAIPVADRITLRLTGDYEERESSYERAAVSIGLALRF
ncbi:YaiO family outer membrane beta-barrel protein [Parasphingopyxis marina]|uniref:YaiO family outer membrane beta-barrel protein n=1 Tax=Parasphingopyxis marina TaxID=2761622 RepID=A0A842I0C8_9SPHN|nr:YaiO family outer membrane beta-barrel protein [Parasphingopyxis marina]MBC2778133.1 YaiO family outer membrane beta-barrel protein [Parasphingopyxis marina]